MFAACGGCPGQVQRIDHVRTIRPAPPAPRSPPSRIALHIRFRRTPSTTLFQIIGHPTGVLIWAASVGKAPASKETCMLGQFLGGACRSPRTPRTPGREEGHISCRESRFYLVSTYVRTTYVFRGRGRLDEACGRTRPQVGAVVADLGGLFEIRWGMNMCAAACRPWCHEHHGPKSPLYRFSQAIG